MAKVLHEVPVEDLKLVVFDLDGTLIDSARDLANSVNAALEHMGRPHLADDIIAGFVGNGAAMLVRRSLAEEEKVSPDDVHDEELARAYQFFIQHYHNHNLDFTYAYQGVAEAVKALSEHYRLAVLTNKPVRPARHICEGLGLAPYFAAIYGGDSFPLKKPDPMGLNKLISEAGATPQQTLMIGDSKVDVLTARNAGAWSLGCQFGFGPQNLHEEMPDVLVDSANDWTALLNPAKIKK